MNPQKLKEVGIGLGAVILQVLFFRHLKIWGMQPDIVLIYLLWYMGKGSRTAALLMAAFLGLTQDAFLDLWGLNMFAKTLLTFIIYNWIPNDSETRLQLPRVLTTVFVAALVHNIIFLGISSMVQSYTAELFFWRKWIGNSLYTTLLAAMIQLFRTD